VVTLVLWALMAVLFLALYRKRHEPVLVITEGRKH
jgi:hypothetical protein